MANYLSVECFVCGEFTNLHRCGLVLGPSSKRRPTKKHSVCQICYRTVKRFLETRRQRCMWMQNIAEIR